VVFLIDQALLETGFLWIGYAPIFVAFWTVLILRWVLVRFALSRSLSRAIGFDPRLIDAFRSESARAGGPVRREVSILIADVRNYTHFVSSTDATVVSRIMTEYMEAMEKCITTKGGYINKYVGDEIIAVFGFPLTADQSASRAVRAGLGMLDELARLVSVWKERSLSSIDRIGVGIDYGTVTFTEVGGRTKSQFDIIGDCINGASRIEHLTKELGRSLLVSEEALHALENDDSLSGSFELVKAIAVRGQGMRRVFAPRNG
jgi:class 3 adenylate cyclase